MGFGVQGCKGPSEPNTSSFRNVPETISGILA